MNALWGILILAVTVPAVSDGRHPDAVEIFNCDFEVDWDVNYDQWPDEWTRKAGPGFPEYIKVGLAPDPADAEQRCLRIDLDGGAASVYSPPIPVDSRFSYVLEGLLKTESLQHDRAFVTVTFYDADRQPLETYYSRKTADAPQWQAIEFEGPLSPHDDQVELAVIGLHLHPGEHQDLRGSALFDQIWFARLPRMSLHTNHQSNVFGDPAEVEITCDLSGIGQRDPLVHFELFDATGKRIAEKRVQLDGQRISGRSSSARGMSEESGGLAGYAGQVRWEPEREASGVLDFGFYRVGVTMRSPSGTVHERRISLAVIRELQHVSGEFGWTLPRGDSPLPLEALTELLPHVGINWLKFPVWYGPEDDGRGDELMRFVERLGSARIELVGMLDRPPPETIDESSGQQSISAANLFSDAAGEWFTLLDPVLTRLSLKIRWWQLGGDRDTSFVGYPYLPETLQAVRERLFRFGQKVQLGLGWQWPTEMQQRESLPWEFVTLSANPPLASAELADYLDGTDSRYAKRWVLVEPLPRGDYPLSTRATDLVEQMMTAKIHQADAIFLPNPFSTERGLMNDDGTPGELLLPWRTTSLMIGGSQYLGSIRMPQGSHNHIFVRGDRAVMIVWNEKPVEEILYLGEQVQQYDIWGQRTTPGEDEHGQNISVGRVPTFVTGVSVPVTQWRLAVEFEQTQLPSVFGKPHRNQLTIKNFFNQGAGGKIVLQLPKMWRVDPDWMHLNMAAGETLQKPFEITLPFDASTGRQDVRIDFEIEVDRPYKFSVYRELEIGLGDMVIELSSWLDENENLVVEQRMTNHSSELVDFKCLLYAPGRRRQRNQVFRLGQGQDVKLYHFPGGRELVDQSLYLRAEEIGGQRVLNYRFTAQE